MNKNIEKLTSKLQENNLDFYVIFSRDEFFSEYVPEHKQYLKAICGFTGSNGILIVGLNERIFLTDGRYVLQAQKQVKDAKIVNLADFKLSDFIAQNKDKKIAFDAQIISQNQAQYYLTISKNLVFLDESLINFVLRVAQTKLNFAYEYDLNYAGIDSTSKRKDLCTKFDQDYFLFTLPDSICWLLNIRGSDVKCNPILQCFGILHQNGNFDLFANISQIKDLKLENVNYHDFGDFKSVIANFSGKIAADLTFTSHYLHQTLQSSGLKVENLTDICQAPKAQKNETEIKWAKYGHQKDAIALNKFLFWLENQQHLDEKIAADKLLEFRAQNKEFKENSFNTISSFGSNGAVIHYDFSNNDEVKKFDQKSLYLVDSGGQYFGCTTDVTRVIAYGGDPDQEQIENFTRVLKGNLAISRLKFPKGITGSQIDVLGRYYLWSDFKDYEHGTGHGVGSFLSVHEGPQSISKRNNNIALKEGMIISNEPGYYKEGEYGIRIENLLLVEKCPENDNFLQFNTLTLAVIDHRLINFKMLTYPEKKWLINYHQRILDEIGQYLNENELNWLKKIVQIYKQAC